MSKRSLKILAGAVIFQFVLVMQLFGQIVGPPAVRVNGQVYNYTATSDGNDTYVGGIGQFVTIGNTGSAPYSVTFNVDGGTTSSSGTYAGVFQAQDVELIPVNANGSFLVPITDPANGPAGLAVNGHLWSYQGTYRTSGVTTDQYVGPLLNQLLWISGNGSVTGEDSNLGGSAAFTATYSNGSFTIISGTSSLERVWFANGLLSPQFAPCSAIYINNQPWTYVGSSRSHDYFTGPQGLTGGQELTIDGSGNVSLYDPYNNISATGSYANGTFNLGSQVNALTAQQEQDFLSTQQSELNQLVDQTTQNTSKIGGLVDADGNLDILGTILSLGTASETSNPGLKISASDGVVNFTAGQPQAVWQWNVTPTGGGSPGTVMMVDSNNRLMLYDPTNPSNPPTIIDPTGVSTAISVPPQGDLLMWTAPQQ